MFCPPLSGYNLPATPSETKAKSSKVEEMSKDEEISVESLPSYNYASLTRESHGIHILDIRKKFEKMQAELMKELKKDILEEQEKILAEQK